MPARKLPHLGAREQHMNRQERWESPGGEEGSNATGASAAAGVSTCLTATCRHHVRIDHHSRNRKRRGIDRECSEATGIPNHFDTVMNEGEAIVQLVVAAGCDAATPGNHDRNYKYDRLAQINSVETADAAQPNAQIDARSRSSIPKTPRCSSRS